MKVIERCGYGASFNELTVVGDIIKKRSKNTYGLTKIGMEINFYKYVIEHQIKFPIANTTCAIIIPLERLFILINIKKTKKTNGQTIWPVG